MKSLLVASINDAPDTVEKGWYIPRRYLVAGLLFLMSIIAYAIRVVLSMTIITMANESKDGWSESTQGLLLSSFFWGYILTQLPSGAFQMIYGPHLILNIGVLVTCVSCALTPLVSHSVPLIILLRMLTGVGEGAILTCIHALCAKWIPQKERAFLLNCIWGGLALGTVFATAVTPMIISSIGWQPAFYFYGIAGIVWSLGWVLCADSSPEDMYNKTGFCILSIRKSEVQYIQSTTSAGSQELSLRDIPWKKFFSHSATYALIVAHFVHNWGFYVLLTWMPKFLKSVGFDISKNGLYAVLPYVMQAITGPIYGRLSDMLISRNIISKTVARKICIAIGFLGPAILLAVIGFRIKGSQDGVLAVGLLTGALGLASASASGYGVNHMDIGPKYAGILIGISNTIATIPGIVGVYLTGFILDHSGGNWLIIWLLASSLFVVGVIVFSIFGKGNKIFD